MCINLLSKLINLHLLLFRFLNHVVDGCLQGNGFALELVSLLLQFKDLILKRFILLLEIFKLILDILHFVELLFRYLDCQFKLFDFEGGVVSGLDLGFFGRADLFFQNFLRYNLFGLLVDW